ncbi:hypothetical protein ACOSQ2_023669 [Xanthoceras sorbifolium]|uniref:Uncharacterized protein n=1 Tax=Xanthoceras sorbifolium TaxID=99658 RepID=A0ABQ8HQZ2_9ROSI|nr:hypothetical protein JRO89_XS08G0220800 [Xanthoceras sorbifolium]
MKSMNTKKSSKDGKLSKYFKSTVRILVKARDFYIRSMTECSDKVTYGTAMGCPTGQPLSLPRSYSVSSSKSSGNDDDFRELVRAASTRGLAGKIDQDLLRKQQVRQTPTTLANNNIPRSYSVGIGRIDEDKACDDFDDDVKLKTNLYPRSRSHAAVKRTGLF